MWIESYQTMQIFNEIPQISSDATFMEEANFIFNSQLKNFSLKNFLLLFIIKNEKKILHIKVVQHNVENLMT